MNLSQMTLLLSACLAVCAPIILKSISTVEVVSAQFPGWPNDYQGNPLTQLNLTENEAVFLKGFPGKIGRFSDGNRELIIRWIETPTRKLHSAADCFKGIGYYIKPKPIQINEQGIKMGCFTASKANNELNVCEYIESKQGKNWSDISAWYWGVLMEDTSSGWMSYVIAEKR